MSIQPELIDKLCEASDSQIDANLKPRLQSLKGMSDEDAKDVLKSIIADSINYSLTSGFSLSVFQSLYVGLGGELSEVIGTVRVEGVE